MPTTLLVTNTYNPTRYRNESGSSEVTLTGDPDRKIVQALDVVHQLQEERIERINDQIKEAAASAVAEADNATDHIRQALDFYVAQLAEGEGATLDIEAITGFVRECFENVESNISAATAEHDSGTVGYKVVVY